MAVSRLPLLVALLLVACEPEDTELQRTHAYMDSLGVFLGELRLMDHQLNKIITADTLAAEIIVPEIAGRFRPTIAGLRGRVAAVPTTPAVDTTQTLLLQYLDTRLAAYDAAIQGHAEDRPDLFEVFARKQIEAQNLGDELEAQVQRLRGELPGFN